MKRITLVLAVAAVVAMSVASVAEGQSKKGTTASAKPANNGSYKPQAKPAQTSVQAKPAQAKQPTSYKPQATVQANHTAHKPQTTFVQPSHTGYKPQTTCVPKTPQHTGYRPPVNPPVVRPVTPPVVRPPVSPPRLPSGGGSSFTGGGVQLTRGAHVGFNQQTGMYSIAFDTPGDSGPAILARSGYWMVVRGPTTWTDAVAYLKSIGAPGW